MPRYKVGIRAEYATRGQIEAAGFTDVPAFGASPSIGRVDMQPAWHYVYVTDKSEDAVREQVAQALGW